MLGTWDPDETPKSMVDATPIGLIIELGVRLKLKKIWNNVSM